jgi:predicted dehydrogenase
MKRNYNWGILGPGKIAHRFTGGLNLLENATLHAVGSRSEARAREFASKYGYKRYYGSYEELVKDPELDVVYVASPHSHHKEHTLLCLDAGKSVICEKAFAINSSEVREMIEAAKGKNLFLMEALWPPFQPSYKRAHEELATGNFGEVMTVRSFFAFKPPYEPEKRLYNTDLGGGALLDIGIYPVIDALTFLGVPDKIHSIATFDKTGADDNIDMLFGYNDGRSAALYSSLKTGAGIGTDLLCENGTIVLRRLRDGTQILRLQQEGQEPEDFTYSPESRGFNFEAEEVMSCLNQNKTESNVVPLSFSLDLIDTLDRIKRDAGIKYIGRD